MQNRILTQEQIRSYAEYLQREERSVATCEKYRRDVEQFQKFAGSCAVTKELLVQYKKTCIERGYAVRSINSMLAAVNSLMRFLGWDDVRVKNLRIQRQTFCAEERELTKAEYFKLLKAAENNEQLRLVLQAICATGIRVSELRFFTVETIQSGKITVSCKNKTRTILIPGKLKKLLLRYAKQKKIIDGPIFVGKRGKSLDRSYIWRKMKQLCLKAGINATKVFPHNLRKLFARSFYSVEKDIAKLADILGHSSINTTRIYIMTTGEEHRKKIERLGLLI